MFLIFVAISPLCLLILPIDYFDRGDSICIYNSLTEINCLGCGLTRGIMHLIHLDFKGAWDYSPLSIIIFPCLVMIWLHVVGKIFNKSIFPFFEKLY
ncbi:MAG: DUF2752 domain-containing protein [Bacteroidota bacterium]